MATTLTNGEVALGIRATTDANNVPPPIMAILGFMVPAASRMVIQYAPGAPNEIHNMALVRLVGWMFDADPAAGQASNAMQLSGASSMLAQWKVQRVGVVSDPPSPASLPAPPGEGNFILISDNGFYVWIPFPKPPDQEDSLNEPGFLPDAPTIGEYSLTIDNGIYEWVKFPRP